MSARGVRWRPKDAEGATERIGVDRLAHTCSLWMTFVIHMKEIPRISETEWELMKIVWARAPISSTDLVAELSGQGGDWHPKTIRTLLARLVKKKAVKAETTGRVHVYRPLVTERECVAAASRSFVDRVFGGSLKPMLAFFAEDQRLTKEDLAELHALLESNPSGGRKKK